MDLRTKNKLLKKIDALPQAEHIPEERREKWIDIMMARDPARIEWHIERLRGFGASEIGTLVLNREGKNGKFGSARHIMLQKLMIIPADPESHAMVMGTLGEQIVRTQFLDFSEGQSRVDLTHKFKGYVHSRYPWMRSTPDDLIEIDSAVYMVDYKLPTEAVQDDYREEEGIDFEYACQLTQGSIIGHDLGIELESSLLVNLDTKASQNYYINIRQLDFNDDLQKKIVEAGNHFFKMMLNGQLPEVIRKAPVDLSEDGQLKSMLDALTREMVLAKEAESRVSSVRDRIDTLIGDRELDGPLKGGLIDLSLRKTLNKDLLVEESEAAGINVDDFMVSKESIDYKGLEEALKDKAIANPPNLYTISHTIGLPRGKKGDRIEKLNALKDEAEQLILHANESLQMEGNLVTPDFIGDDVDNDVDDSLVTSVPIKVFQ